MNIVISEQAKDYLNKKNIKSLSLSMKRSSACCGSLSTPTVEYAEPAALNKAALNKYDHYLVDNINVYIDKVIKAEDGELNFVFKGFLKLKYVDVEGIKLM